jgi:hypothetical protein
MFREMGRGAAVPGGALRRPGCRIRPKHFYYAVRWETGTVKKGDFSEIYSAIIP